MVLDEILFAHRRATTTLILVTLIFFFLRMCGNIFSYLKLSFRIYLRKWGALKLMYPIYIDLCVFKLILHASNFSRNFGWISMCVPKPPKNFTNIFPSVKFKHHIIKKLFNIFTNNHLRKI